MNFLKILGSLPASDSASGHLGEIDYLKLIRMSLVMAVSYAVVAILEAVMRDVSNGSFGIPAELTTIVTGALSIALEAARRKLASPAI